MKDFNILINTKKMFDTHVKNKEVAQGKIIEVGRNNDYTTGNLLDYQCFLKHYKPNEIDLSKKTELENIGLKQKITFIGRLDEDNVT